MNITKLNITKLPHRLFFQLLDFIYPPVCIACNKPISDGNQKICPDCWDALQPVTRQLPLYQETGTKLLSAGFISNLVSCFVFEKEGPFQHIAHALKYQEFKSLGIELGKQIGRKIIEWEIDIDTIIPIPLHNVKQRERGYNQAELIAQGISLIIGKPVANDVVRRIRHTQTQTKLNLEERQKNMEDAFATTSSAPNVIEGKVCLLVDDIITTGATTNSCAKELIAIGASKVIAASAALAQ